MRGQVIEYFQTSGSGLISGEDGLRYSFTADDVARREGMRLHVQVDFLTNGDKARDIFPLWEAASTTPPQFGAATAARWSSSSQTPVESLSLWGYFVKCLRLYADGKGRARRKEYWGFALFSSLFTFGLILLALLGLVALEGSSQPEDSPAYISMSVIFVVLLSVAFLGMLALAPPAYAVTARRLHDLGMNGWLTLLVLVPYVGGFIIFVFSVIPSQEMDNQYGLYPKTRPQLN